MAHVHTEVSSLSDYHPVDTSSLRLASPESVHSLSQQRQPPEKVVEPNVHAINIAASPEEQAGSKSKQWIFWLVPALTIGAYVFAILMFITHYLFFSALDGKDIENALGLRQSYVNTVSLLLVTVFRAAILYAVGASFTQYLWHLLRNKTLTVGLIEELFQIRSNPLGLANYKVPRYAPLLFVAAAFSWLVPLAMIYPPGALTIRSNARSSLVETNVSTFNPSSPRAEELPILMSMYLSAYTDRGDEGGIGEKHYTNKFSTEEPYIEMAPTYAEPLPQVPRLARFVMSTGQILPMAPVGGENSSYGITFEGPLLRCHDVGNTTTTIDLSTAESISLYDVQWKKFNDTDSYASYFEQQPSRLIVQSSQIMGWYATDLEALRKMQYIIVLQKSTRECAPYTTTYSANISYVRGIQQTTWERMDTNEKPLEFQRAVAPFQYDSTRNSRPEDSQEFKDWWPKYTSWRYMSNNFATIDALASNLQLKMDAPGVTTLQEESNVTYQLENGTEVNLRPAYPAKGQTPDSLLADSVFNTHLNRENFTSQNDNPLELFEFDPRRDLDLSEAMLNEVLFNITISALTLGTWHETLNTTDKTFITFYRFSDPWQFFLPYTACLALALAIIGMGMHALAQNGVTAIDGGFIQILMTTTGDTKLRRAAVAGSLGGKENIPAELLNTEVRFGELINEEGVAVAGFGTVDETLPLKRRSGYTTVAKEA